MCPSLRFLLSVSLLLLVCSCARRPSPDVYQRSYDFVKQSAERNVQSGEYGKAYYLTSILLDASPRDLEVMAIQDRALVGDPSLKRLDRRETLGRNRPLRTSSGASVPGKVLLWPVNLITDLLDIVTIEVGVGIGAGAKAQVTEPVSAGAQFSLGQTMLGFQTRHPSVRAAFENYLDIFPFEIRALSEASYGTFGASAVNHGGTGFKVPSDRLYMNRRDYYAIGAEVLAGIPAAKVQVHPLQLYDWLLGLIFVDPMMDNVGSSKSIGRLDPDELEAVKRLIDS